MLFIGSEYGLDVYRFLNMFSDPYHDICRRGLNAELTL